MNFERLVQRTAATLLMSMICLISLAQSRTVSGVVLDSRGDPVTVSYTHLRAHET